MSEQQITALREHVRVLMHKRNSSEPGMRHIVRTLLRVSVRKLRSLA